MPPPHPHPLYWEDKPEINPAWPGESLYPRVAQSHNTDNMSYSCLVLASFEDESQFKEGNPPLHNKVSILGGSRWG